MTEDEQAARSWFQSSARAIILVPVNGRVAVFNRAQELCGFATTLEEVLEMFKAPKEVVIGSGAELLRSLGMDSK